jgi:hypothetical protein
MQLRRKVGDRPYLSILAEKGEVCGTVSRAGLWLHCVVGWQVTAFLKSQLRCFWILNQLHFRCREDVYGLISGIQGEGDYVLEREKIGLQIPMLFLGEWEFDKEAIAGFADSRCVSQLWSKPKMFVGPAGDFKVSLVLSNKSMDRLQLRWEVEVGAEFGEVNAEGAQLNLEISGAACSGSNESVPSIAAWLQTTPGDDFAVCSSLGQQLLSGLPLLCCLRIALSNLKECCAVQPLQWIQCNDRDLVLEQLMVAS